MSVRSRHPRRLVLQASSNDELCRAVSDALDGITADGTLEAVHSVWYGTMPYDLTTKTVSGANVQPGDSESSETTSSGSESSDSNNETASSEDKSSSRKAPSPTTTLTNSIASYC